MTLWLNHTIDERIAMLQRAEEKFRINQVAIEKDWWVTVVLNALFKCSCADHSSLREVQVSVKDGI